MHTNLPSLEYSSTVWNPHSTGHKKRQSGIVWLAARFILLDCRQIVCFKHVQAAEVGSICWQAARFKFLYLPTSIPQ